VRDDREHADGGADQREDPDSYADDRERMQIPAFPGRSTRLRTVGG
jgi:hypothetical protein